MTTPFRMPRITVRKLDAWEACHRAEGGCYTDEHLKDLSGGRKSILLDEALRLGIPDSDKCWLACQALPRKLVNGWVKARIKAYRCNKTYRYEARGALEAGRPYVALWWLEGWEPHLRSLERILAKEMHRG